MERDRLRRMARGDRQRRRPSFQRRHALFEHGGRRIGDAGVDIAESLQAEQRGGMVDIVEHEGRRLIDRRRPGAGRRIGPRAGMDR